MQKYFSPSQKASTAQHTWLAGFLLCVLLLFGLTGCTTGIFGGQAWEAGGLQSEHLQVLTADPNHLHTIYAGDARDGVFVSPDTGVSWKKSDVGLPLPLTVNALSFDIPGKKLFAATSAGLFVSSDFANSWSQVAHIPAGAYTALAIDANSPKVVYAANTNATILKSNDDGANWTSISSGLPSGAITSMLYDPNLKQLWAAFADVLYRSDDNGTSWHAMSNGLPTNVSINTLVLGNANSGSNNLLLVGTKHGFFRSTNAGQHWAPSHVSLAGLQIQDILPDATQPNVVYISTTIGVLTSKDNGQSWGALASGLPTHQSFAGLAQAGDNYSQLLVASRGIYLYPGTQSVLSPTRFLPIILILLFFFLLYYFFAMRRRRSLGLSSKRVRDTPIAGNRQNGHSPLLGSGPTTPRDEDRKN